MNFVRDQREVQDLGTVDPWGKGSMLYGYWPHRLQLSPCGLTGELGTARTIHTPSMKRSWSLGILDSQTNRSGFQHFISCQVTFLFLCFSSRITLEGIVSIQRMQSRTISIWCTRLWLDATVLYCKLRVPSRVDFTWMILCGVVDIVTAFMFSFRQFWCLFLKFMRYVRVKIN